MWSSINKVPGKSCLNVRKWIGHHYAHSHTSSLQVYGWDRLPGGWVMGTPCPGIMVKPDPFAKEGQPWQFLNTKMSKMPFWWPFLHFLAGDLLLPIETWKPLGCLFPAPFLQHHSWPSLSRNKRHKFSSSKGWHEAVEGKQVFLVWLEKSPIWVVSAFQPREPGLPIQACFSQ